MAQLKNNGSELLRWRQIITYPNSIDNTEMVSERIHVFSFRSNGYILQKTITISTLFDKPDRFTTNWTRYKKIKADKDLTTVANRLKTNVQNISEFTTKSGSKVNYVFDC